jgi:hypothetical protein
MAEKYRERIFEKAQELVIRKLNPNMLRKLMMKMGFGLKEKGLGKKISRYDLMFYKLKEEKDGQGLGIKICKLINF